MQVSFHTEHEQPGVIVMDIESQVDQVEDPHVKRVAVVLNATPDQYNTSFPASWQHIEVHQQMKGLPHISDCLVDNEAKTLSIAPTTIIVLVEPFYTG